MGLFSLEDSLDWLIVSDCNRNQVQVGREVIRGQALEHHDSSSVTMETGKPGFVSVPVHSSSVAAQTENKMDIQAPLMAVYVQTVPALPPHPYPQTRLPTAPQEPATLHLSVPPLFSKETLPFLTLHIAGGLQSQQQGPSLAAAVPPAARPKSAGKHVCPHCGRDCMKPSVLEKHLRCHTGERPYPCATCGISFKTQSNLYKHKRTQAHARLSCESEQSSLGSQDGPHGSRDTCASSFSLDTHCEDSANLERDIVQPPTEIVNPASAAQVPFVERQGSDVGRTPTMDTGNGQKELSFQVLHINPAESLEITKGEEKQYTERKKPPLTPHRHLPLQRQEATLFSKQWENSVSRGKSQSHDSTDSGFSESSDHYPSPGSVLPDHSMESLAESSLELPETTPGGSQTPVEPGQTRPEPNASVAQRTLEEHISKLISENDAVVEDKHLENVRPRKTVLSKQGSIDLPMPYTYKDSFHFDMRISKATNAGFTRQRPDKTRKPSMYCSVPTQCSTSMDHAPLTRSSSLPFSVTLLHSERNSLTSSFQGDYVTLARRGSSGQIHPSGFAMKSVDQQVSNHRPLVRQAAVDCNHATEGLFINSSVEEACASSLSSDGDSVDICGEPSNRKCQRKKVQKFAYNKWYMYGGGTFTKLYGTDKGRDNSVPKARKSLTNLEHEGVQGAIQRRFPAVNRETATTTTTGSTINSTGSSAAMCHPSCLPVNLPTITSVDFNQKPSQLNSSCASLKSPLLKNVSSLSTLQSPPIGSLDTHNTDGVIGAEAEKLNNNEKHTDSISQHCGGHIPSDRKKQKTDEKITCSSETQIDPNTSKTSTQPFRSVIGGVAKQNGRPQTHNQDRNISFINLQSNQKPVQLKGALSPPCMINANGTSVSTSPAISIISTVKTSFLPKYQLKLPTAVEADTHPSPQTLNQLTEELSHDSTTSLSSSHIDQASISTFSSSPEKKSTVHFLPLPVHSHTHGFKRTNSAAQSQPVSPLMATSPCRSVTSTTALNQNVSPTSAIAQGQFTTIAKTTASEHYHHAKLYTTFIQNAPAKPATASTPNLPTRHLAPTTQNSSAPPIITTAQNLPSATGFTSPPHHGHPPLSHAHDWLTSGRLNPVNRVPAGLNTLSCQIIPHDSARPPAAQNVFHVRTADLHICLEIISDEQLALIEPQIERLGNTAGVDLSLGNNLEAMDPGVIGNEVQSSVGAESMNIDHATTGHQREEERWEPSTSRNAPSVKPPLSVNSHQAPGSTLVAEHGDVNQATKSAESTPSESPGLSLGPLSPAHKNMLTKTMRITDSAMSALVLLKGMQLERNQTPREDHLLLHDSFAEQQHLPERSVSQESLAGTASSFLSTAAQDSTGSGLVQEGSQHKRINQKAACLAAKLKTKRESSVFGEARPSLQARLGPSSGAEFGDGLAGKVPSFPSDSDCITPRDVNPQAPVYSGDLRSCEPANVGSDSVGRLDHSAPSQVVTLGESQDNIHSNLLETSLSLFTSVAGSIQVERPKDAMSVLSTNQSPAAGSREGGSPVGGAVQKEPKDHVRRTLGQLDSADWEPNWSQRNGGTDHLCTEELEERGGGGGAEDGENRGVMIIATEDVPEQREAGSGSNGRSDEIVKEEKNAKADSYKNSCLSKQHHLSQTQFGMSDNPPLPPQQEESTSSNPNPLGSSDASLSNTLWPESESNNIYFSQQSCEINSYHNQQTQVPFENNASLQINQLSSLVETHVLCQSETSHQHTQQPIQDETILHQNHHTQQDQEETNITSPAQSLPSRETDNRVNNSNSPNCSNNSVYSTEGQRAPNHLAAVKPPTSIYPSLVSHSVHANRARVRMAANSQAISDGPSDNTIHPSKSWTPFYSDPDDKLEEDQATPVTMTHSTNAVTADGSDKYQSLLSTGQFHSLAEVLTSGVRPVQSSQEDPDDTSSSDDEGKLIIEL